MRILIITDEDAAGSALSRTLTAEGHQVRWAVQGDVGILLAQLFPPDLIVLDSSMRLLDGTESVQAYLSADPQLRGIPTCPFHPDREGSRASDRLAT